MFERGEEGDGGERGVAGGDANVAAVAVDGLGRVHLAVGEAQRAQCVQRGERVRDRALRGGAQQAARDIEGGEVAAGGKRGEGRGELVLGVRAQGEAAEGREGGEEGARGARGVEGGGGVLGGAAGARGRGGDLRDGDEPPVLKVACRESSRRVRWRRCGTATAGRWKWLWGCAGSCRSARAQALRGEVLGERAARGGGGRGRGGSERSKSAGCRREECFRP